MPRQFTAGLDPPAAGSAYSQSTSVARSSRWILISGSQRTEENSVITYTPESDEHGPRFNWGSGGGAQGCGFEEPPSPSDVQGLSRAKNVGPKQAAAAAATTTAAAAATTTFFSKYYAWPWPAPNCPYPHAPQKAFFINGFFIDASSLNVRSPLLVRQAQWQWRSTREGRARKGRGKRSLP